MLADPAWLTVLDRFDTVLVALITGLATFGAAFWATRTTLTHAADQSSLDREERERNHRRMAWLEHHRRLHDRAYDTWQHLAYESSQLVTFLLPLARQPIPPAIDVAAVFRCPEMDEQVRIPVNRTAASIEVNKEYGDTALDYSAPDFVKDARGLYLRFLSMDDAKVTEILRKSIRKDQTPPSVDEWRANTLTCFHQALQIFIVNIDCAIREGESGAVIGAQHREQQQDVLAGHCAYVECFFKVPTDYWNGTGIHVPDF